MRTTQKRLTCMPLECASWRWSRASTLTVNAQTLHRFTRKSRRQRTHRPRPDFVHALRERVMCAQRTMPASLQTIVDEKTKGFIELCLQHEHQHRPSASQVFTHEYLQLPFNDPDDDQPVELRRQTRRLVRLQLRRAAAPLPASQQHVGFRHSGLQFGSAFAAAHRCHWLSPTRRLSQPLRPMSQGEFAGARTRRRGAISKGRWRGPGLGLGVQDA